MQWEIMEKQFQSGTAEAIRNY